MKQADWNIDLLVNFLNDNCSIRLIDRVLFIEPNHQKTSLMRCHALNADQFFEYNDHNWSNKTLVLANSWTWLNTKKTYSYN